MVGNRTDYLHCYAIRPNQPTNLEGLAIMMVDRDVWQECVSRDSMFSGELEDDYDDGAHGVMVIVVGNGHGDTSSNPG